MGFLWSCKSLDARKKEKKSIPREFLISPACSRQILFLDCNTLFQSLWCTSTDVMGHLIANPALHVCHVNFTPRALLLSTERSRDMLIVMNCLRWLIDIRSVNTLRLNNELYKADWPSNVILPLARGSDDHRGPLIVYGFLLHEQSGLKQRGFRDYSIAHWWEYTYWW